MSTVGDRLYELGGVPVGVGTHSGFPCIGDVYWVDGTNGLDSNTGLKPHLAKKTIDATITTQIANTDSLGDIIYILPGTYAESITTTTLNNVKLIGYSADSVIVAPTASHAMAVGTDESVAVSMTNSVIKNMTFLTPSTSNPTYAALLITVMTKSVIEDCMLKGTTATGFYPTETVGLQLGSRTHTPWEFPEFNRISRCEFSSNGGRTYELGIGIRVGDAAATAPESRGFKSNIIEDCIISAYDTGILLNTGSSSCNASVIRRNVVTSMQGGVGVNLGIVSGSTDGTDAMCMVLDNRIAAISDCISNFSTCNVQGNIVATGGGTPVDETSAN